MLAGVAKFVGHDAYRLTGREFYRAGLGVVVVGIAPHGDV
jgi:hypothetical protein